MKKLVVAKRASQAVFLFLFVYSLWMASYSLHDGFLSGLFFRTDPLVIGITSISERTLLCGTVISFVMILLAFIFGRFYCGWVCPLGASIDLAGWTGKKIKKVPRETVQKARVLKFFILFFIFILACFGMQFAWVLDPTVIMGRFVSLNFIPGGAFLTDLLFVKTMETFKTFSGPLYDAYTGFTSSVLSVNGHHYSNSMGVILLFLVICFLSFAALRFWCRVVCPLGALYGICAGKAVFGRTAKKCVNCGLCVDGCPMGAIKDGNLYDKQECVLCMDCVYNCPRSAVRFEFPQKSVSVPDGAGIDRKDFLLMMGMAFLSMGFKRAKKGSVEGESVIRPPAALKGEAFLDRCVRCGNCMKACVTNGLQPVFLESGWRGLWTPQLVPEIGHCEFNCNLCGKVCPTGAIKNLPLGEKQKVKLGLAEINKKICIAWGLKEDCIVCQEYCPLPEKAIKLVEEKIGSGVLYKPEVDDKLCIGCGACQNACPVRPVRAIRVIGSRV